MSKSSRAGWPESMIRLAAIVGDAAALQLMTDFGGTKIYVPSARGVRQTILARSIGLKAARALAGVHGGDFIEVPTGDALRNKKRAILSAEGSGRKVARAIGSTERYVRMVRNAGSRADARQRTLPLGAPPGKSSV